MRDLHKIVTDYKAVLAEAVEIAEQIGLFLNDEGQRLEIVGADAIIVSCDDASDGYGWVGVEEERVSFPLAFLEAQGQERAMLISRHLDERNARSIEQQAAYLAKREAEDRAAYEALKARFG